MTFDIIYPRDIIRILRSTNGKLIDLRERAMFRESHIEGAVNYPLEEIEKWENRLSPRNYYIFYCEHGGSSTQTARKFGRMGYRSGSLIGGYEAYLKWMEKERKK